MGQPKVLIVEDELITANDIKETLEKEHYEVTGISRTGEKAIILAREELPDLIIMDIQLAGEITGIEAAREILRIKKIPILFLTANDDLDSVSEVKKMNPVSFLTKPLRTSDFITNIALALNNHKEVSKLSQKNIESNAIFIPAKNGHKKLENRDIFFIEASGSYVSLFTNDKPLVLSTNIGHLQKQLASKSFLRISRKHIVNLDYIERIESNVVVIKNRALPVGESYRNELYNHLQIIKTK